MEMEEEEGGNAPDPAELRDYLNIVYREAERLSALVEDLLSLARIDSDELHLDVAPIVASEVVEEVYATMAPLARRERQVTLIRKVAPMLPLILADRQRLVQVLLNLLRNAITYTPQGGLLASHPGRAFSREFLLQPLWGYDYDGFDRTVDTHMTRLRKKRGPVGEKIVTVWSVGYRFVV